jgi:hypothetical protein
MDEFELKGNGEFLKITIQKVFGFPESTSHSGGYDTKSTIEINSGAFQAKSELWVSTGEIFEFYNALNKANELIQGIVYFVHLEDYLKFTIEYNVNGQVKIKGTFDDFESNSLTFEFVSDQSYIQSTLQQLRSITGIYGGMKGIK